MSDQVEVVLTKWGGRPHWTFGTHRLGQDEHGVWLAATCGTPMSRPGAGFRLRCDCVVLVPPEQPYVASFYADPAATGYPAVYVDITTPAQWRNEAVTMVDLDLDVVQNADGSVYVDDEDEFLDHQRRFGYPPHVVTMAERSCAAVRTALASGQEPFKRAGRDWLARLAAADARGLARGRWTG